MNFNFGAGTSNKVAGTQRRSQIISTFGPGSIVDMPDYSVVMASLDHWDTSSRLRIHEPSLERLMGLDYFVQPKTQDVEYESMRDDIPAYRFPTYHFCSSCNRLMPFWKFGDSNCIRCGTCGRNSRLIPSRFVAACINGHLEDFPYKWWVHEGNGHKCTESSRDDALKIQFNSNTGGLDSIVIECTASGCIAKRSMEGSMSKDALRGFSCYGRRPWIGHGRESNDPTPCQARLRTLQRGGSNVYYSMTKNALTIPPWSGKIQFEIEEHLEELRLLYSQGADENTMRSILKAKFDRLLKSGFCSLDEIVKEVERRITGAHADEQFDEKVLMQDEYRALAHENYNDHHFKTERSEVPELFKKFFDNVVLVKRLREVMVLKGFRRIEYLLPEPDSETAAGHNGNEYTSLGKEHTDWLPGVELLGEGLFIRFNEERLREWERIVGTRYEDMRNRMGREDVANGKFSARYVLLHTFAHHLIRQMTIECGYSGSAIKERIYSTYPDSVMDMAGILIYTSSPDSDGSLGGLVRQGRTKQLDLVMRNLLQEASWCSSDPLCIQNRRQGYNALNYSACHACTLLPETSCEARNCLLDRVSLVGNIDNGCLGYFFSAMEEKTWQE